MRQDPHEPHETFSQREIAAKEKLTELARILARQAASELAASALEPTGAPTGGSKSPADTSDVVYTARHLGPAHKNLEVRHHDCGKAGKSRPRHDRL